MKAHYKDDPEIITQPQIEERVAGMLELPQAVVKSVIDTLTFVMTTEFENRRPIVIKFTNWGRYRLMFQRRYNAVERKWINDCWILRFNPAMSLKRKLRGKETKLSIKRSCKRGPGRPKSLEIE